MGIAGKIAAGVLPGMLLIATLDAGAADQGFYFGAIGGRADYEFEPSPFPYLAGSLSLPTIRPDPLAGLAPLPPSFAVRAVPVLFPQWQPQDDDKSSAWGILAGYRLMRYAAVEMSYLNLGKLEASRTVAAFPVLTPAVQFNRKLATTGPTASVLGILPLAEQWSVYLRAGVFFADMELDVAIDGNADSIESSSEEFMWGAGTQYDFGERWSVRADFQRFNDVGEVRKTGRADIDLLTLGVIFRL